MGAAFSRDLDYDFYDLNDLVDINPSPGSEYIHSMCEPFNEEMAISEERMKNWLNRYKLPYRYVHCSGHANRSQLQEIIENVNPRTLIPIHTEYPDLFAEFHNNLLKPQKDIKMEYNDDFEIRCNYCGL